jgi:hypothetical protein
VSVRLSAQVACIKNPGVNGFCSKLGEYGVCLCPGQQLSLVCSVVWSNSTAVINMQQSIWCQKHAAAACTADITARRQG